MKTILLFTNTALDFNALGQGSLAAMVITAVFVIIVKPLVNQLIKSNEELAKAVHSLKDTISTGDKDVSARIQEAEQRIVDKFIALVESNIVSKEAIQDIRNQLSKKE